MSRFSPATNCSQLRSLETNVYAHRTRTYRQSRQLDALERSGGTACQRCLERARPDEGQTARCRLGDARRARHRLGSPDEGFIPRELPACITSALRSLGYRTTLHLVPIANMTAEIWRRIQIATDGDWLPDYPTPSSYLPGFFGCRGALGHGTVCDPKLDRQMRQASDLQLRDPSRATALWARIDRELTDRAYWVPTVSLGAAELVSKRLRNYQFNPFGDFIADQAWLR
jgi:hypothetical protein